MTGATDAWLRSDGHVHSTFSDGVSTPEDNLAAAVRAGLDGLVMVDHVRASTTWLPDFVGAVRTLRRGSPIEVVIVAWSDFALHDDSPMLDDTRKRLVDWINLTVTPCVRAGRRPIWL